MANFIVHDVCMDSNARKYLENLTMKIFTHSYIFFFNLVFNRLTFITNMSFATPDMLKGNEFATDAPAQPFSRNFPICGNVVEKFLNFPLLDTIPVAIPT